MNGKRKPIWGIISALLFAAIAFINGYNDLGKPLRLVSLLAVFFAALASGIMIGKLDEKHIAAKKENENPSGV
ncbi:MAG TPA: hypothetical protein VKS81_07750 [Bacteroidota bacterium]|nr:hypothetical protein [Bacteroidota bacterium]